VGTSEIPSQEDMRALLDLAIDKGVRKSVAQMRSVGFIPDIIPGLPTDAAKYEEELEE
jgi:hypothetical protein